MPTTDQGYRNKKVLFFMIDKQLSICFSFLGFSPKFKVLKRHFGATERDLTGLRFERSV